MNCLHLSELRSVRIFHGFGVYIIYIIITTTTIYLELTYSDILALYFIKNFETKNTNLSQVFVIAKILGLIQFFKKRKKLSNEKQDNFIIPIELNKQKASNYKTNSAILSVRGI